MPLHPGYLIHADPAWLDFHLGHSVGRHAIYTRRLNAKMENVQQGGYVFCMRRGENAKHAHMWGQFVGAPESTPRQAWDAHGSGVGAPTFESYMTDMLDFIPGINPDTPVRLLHLADMYAPPTPVALASAGVALIRGATKGWSIGEAEVNAILARDQRDEPSDPEVAAALGEEGRRRLVTHLRLERDVGIVRLAKQSWAQTDPALRCCCCRFSFRDHFGELGAGFIEAHHVDPLGGPQRDVGRQTSVEDLRPVCANCHRMLHRKLGMTVEALAAMRRIQP